MTSNHTASISDKSVFVNSKHLSVQHKTRKTQSSTAFRRLPDCLTDHNAAESIVRLFTAWVEKADRTSDGIIAINLRRQPYSHTTVTRAINWLIKHELLVLTEHGGGYGVASRYLVRWTFTHKSLTDRQKAVNRLEVSSTDMPHTLEEKQENNKQNFFKKKTRGGVSASKNQPHRAVIEKSVRWAMFQLRKLTADKDELTAAAKAIRKALGTGRIWPGPELARFVANLQLSIGDMRPGSDTGPRGAFAYVGHYVHQALSLVRFDRANEAEYRERQREQQEAIRDPIRDFSCRAYNGVAAAT